MLVKVLGAAAGGAFPQWNCACQQCERLRTGTFAGQSRTQAQVAVSENGNAVFVFNSSDAKHFVGVYAVGRDSRDPPSTVQISQNILLKPGVDVYTRGAPALRSSADIDPIDDNRFWFIGAYSGGKFLTCPDGSANYDWAT